MPLQFTFKLHPKHCELAGDEEQVFRALRLINGDYLILWVNKKGETREVIHTSEEVILNILEGYWVVSF